ncbi:MAG: hypothetical protein GX061_01365 [Eubacteriaceae bacterium]|nr:hypothetical protein [Eubacteriaceae bacterium]
MQKNPMATEDCGCKNCESRGYECVPKTKEGRPVFYFEQAAERETVTQKVRDMTYLRQ